MSIDIIKHGAKAHSDSRTVAGIKLSEVTSVCHMEIRKLSPENPAYVLNVLGKSLQTLKQDAK